MLYGTRIDWPLAKRIRSVKAGRAPTRIAVYGQRAGEKERERDTGGAGGGTHSIAIKRKSEQSLCVLISAAVSPPHRMWWTVLAVCSRQGMFQCRYNNTINFSLIIVQLSLCVRVCVYLQVLVKYCAIYVYVF